MTGVYLIVLAAALATVTPRVLGPAGWVSRAPRLGIAAWSAAVAAVLSAVAAGVLLLVAPWQQADAPVCLAWRWCTQAVRGDFGAAGRVAAGTIALLGLALVVRLTVTGVRLARAGRARRADHLRLLRLVGRPCPELDATVIDCARPAAYVVAGRTRRVVVTTGALAVLAGDELAAVLAHERAHAAGRHDLLLDCVRVLHQAFPRTVLFASASTSLQRLVELRADDVATARHAPLSLARALVAMAEAASPGTAAPDRAGTLAVTGGDALERLHRLLSPPPPLTLGRRIAAATGIGLLAVAPAILIATAQIFPIVGICPSPPV